MLSEAESYLTKPFARKITHPTTTGRVNPKLAYNGILRRRSVRCGQSWKEYAIAATNPIIAAISKYPCEYWNVAGDLAARMFPRIIDPNTRIGGQQCMAARMDQ